MELIQRLLEKYNKKVWVMYNSKNDDNIFCKYFTRNLATHTICIISKDKVYIVISSLDKDNVSKIKYDKEKVKVLVYHNKSELDIIIEEIIAKLNFANDISLSYSTMSDKNTDILSHGSYVYISKILKKPYLKYKKKVKFSSAEKIIYDLE